MASHDEEAFLKAMEIAYCLTTHGVLLALCELKAVDIFMQIFGLHGYLGSDGIASNLATQNTNACNMLDRMLCFLVSRGDFCCRRIRFVSRIPDTKHPRNSEIFCI